MPLLNPLQVNSTPPASTIVEPPRSPNALNPATDESGTNVRAELGSAEEFAVRPVEDKARNQNPNTGLADLLQPQSSKSPILSLAPVQAASSPLPVTAPLPPTPKVKDEVPPLLAVGDIPAAVSEPAIIAAGAPEASESISDYSAPAVQPSHNQDILPGSFPTPDGPIFDPAAAVSKPPPIIYQDPLVKTGNEDSTVGHTIDMRILPDEPMDLDASGEEETEAMLASEMVSNHSVGSIKRAGEEMEGREEKRLKEDSEGDLGSNNKPEVSARPVLAEGFQPAALLPWQTYVLPAPRAGGPTTPLTVTQHKHLLNSVRSLKKAKDAPGFLVPVDVVLFGIPHYHQVIPNPMDLGTVETKLFVSDPRGPPKDKSRMSKWDTSKGNYHSVKEVVDDVRQIWENTRKFNGPDHIFSQGASRLEDTFEKMVNNIPSDVCSLFAKF